MRNVFELAELWANEDATNIELNKNNTMTDNNEIIITSEMLIPEIFSTQASSSPLEVGQLLKMNIKEFIKLIEKLIV